jgi:hypothetical protein
MSTQSLAQKQAVTKPASVFTKTGMLQRKCNCGQHTIAGEECRQTRDGTLQRAAASSAPVNTVPPVVHGVLTSSGQPLDTETRAFMEPRFGHDFSQVRVHTDAQAAESARTVNALAYTVGRDVVFGTGQYEPGTSEGKRLLAHELTHVVQQSRGGISPELNPTASHEGDAEAIYSAIANGQAKVAVQGATGVGLARANSKAPALKALTPEELFMRLVQSVRGFASSPSGAPTNAPTSSLGKGYETFASIQILDKEGNQVLTSIGAYLGGGEAHGETQAIAALQNNLPEKVPGGRMMVVVEQVPCQGCASSIEALANKLGLDQLEVYVPTRASKTGKGQVKPKTAATTSFRGDNPPTTLERVYQKKIGGGSSADISVSKPSTKAGTSSSPEIPSETKVPRISSGTAVAGEAAEKLPPGTRVMPTVEEVGSQRVTPSGKAISTIAEGAGGELGRLGKLMRGIARGVEIFFSPVVQVPLTVLLEIQNVVQALSMAQSGLAGEGFILTNEIKQSQQIEEKVDLLLNHYEEGYHDDLSQAITLANFLILTGSAQARREMAVQSSAILPLLNNRLSETEKRLEKVSAIEKEADAKIEIATKLLQSKEFALLSGFTGQGTLPQAQVLAAREDLYKIRGSMNSAKEKLTKLVSLIKEDIDRLKFYQ